jgi:rod shape-determining protein MreC
VNLDLNNLDIERSFYPFVPARVVKNGVSGINNYIRLNKGSNDGITEDMGVVSLKGGIVGVVVKVSPNFSHVNPVLHSGFHPSCMIKETRFFGSLFWDGNDPRYISLTGLPSHASFVIGDTVVTSGYSATFPEGVLVGVIEGTLKQKNEESNSVKIRLFTDLSTLNEVFIIKNPYREEILQIEKVAIDE